MNSLRLKCLLGSLRDPRAPQIAGWMVIAIGVLVMVGWHAGSTTLIQFRETLAAVKFNTAICFVLSGGALVLLGHGHRKAAAAAGGVVAVIAGVTLAQDVLGVSFGIDELFFRPGATHRTLVNGRMSPLTGICFISAGLAFVVAGSMRRPGRHPLWLGLPGAIIGVISGMAVMGYMTGIEGAFSWAQLTRVALATALAFCVLSAALLRLAWVDHERAGTQPVWLPLTVGLLLIGYLTLLTGSALRSLTEVTDLRRHSSNVLLQMERVRIDLTDVQVGARGYVITGTDPGLAPFLRATNAVPVVLRALDGAVSNKPSQRVVLGELRVLTEELVDFYRRLVQVRRQSGFPVAQAMVEAGEGQRLLREATTRVDRMEAEERRSLEAWNTAAQSASRDSAVLLFTGGGLALAFVALAGWLVQVEIRRRKEIEKNLRQTLSLQTGILDSANYAIVSTDTAGTITTFNRGAERMLGYEAGELIGRKTPAIWHDGDEVARRAEVLSAELDRRIEPSFEAFVAKARQGEVDENEWTFIRRDGSRFPVQLSVTALRDEGGGTSGFLGIIADLTERKRLAAALELNRARFELAARGAVDGIWDWNVVTGELYFSDRWCELLGYAPGELPAHLDSWRERLHPTEKERVMAAVKWHLEQRNPYDLEYRLQTKSGTYRWFRASGQALWDEQGRPLRMAGSLTDVTERRMVEERFRVVVESAPNAFVMVDGQGGIVLVNEQAERLFGFARDEMIGQKVKDIVPNHFPATRSGMWGDFFREHSGRAACERGELFGRRRDGSEIPIEIGLNPIEFGGEKFVLASIVDITERRRAERALRESEERLRLVMELVPVGIFIKDAEGRFEFVNRALLQVNDATYEEMIGRTDFDFARNVAEAEAYRRDDLEVLRNGEVKLIPEETLTDAAGIQRTLQTTKIRFQLPSGQPGVLGVSVDISERKRAEQSIRAALSEKEVLLREVHHRVKNNMQVISSILSLQAGYVDDRRVRQMFADCQGRVQTMAMIHEKLYRSGSLASIRFDAQVREIAEMLLRSHRQSVGHVRLVVQAEAVTLGIDTAIPLGLILNELITNALKYAFADGRAGTLRVGFHFQRPDRLVMSVADDGVGLPPGFDFERGRSLGLKMIRSLTRQLDGSMTIRREQGVEVSLSFPFVGNQANQVGQEKNDHEFT